MEKIIALTEAVLTLCSPTVTDVKVMPSVVESSKYEVHFGINPRVIESFIIDNGINDGRVNVTDKSGSYSSVLYWLKDMPASKYQATSFGSEAEAVLIKNKLLVACSGHT